MASLSTELSDRRDANEVQELHPNGCHVMRTGSHPCHVKPPAIRSQFVGHVLEAVKFLDSYFTVESTIKVPGSDAATMVAE